MYTVCAFVRDWKSGIIVEMNQTAFTEHLMAEYEILPVEHSGESRCRPTSHEGR